MPRATAIEAEKPKEEREKKPKGYSASGSKLPEVNAIDDGVTQAVVRDLLVEAADYKLQADRAEEQLSRIRKELTIITEGWDLPGVRDNRIGFYHYGTTTTRTLNKGKLMEAGVSAETIAACYVESEPRPDVKMVLFTRE